MYFKFFSIMFEVLLKQRPPPVRRLDAPAISRGIIVWGWSGFGSANPGLLRVGFSVDGFFSDGWMFTGCVITANLLAAGGSRMFRADVPSQRGVDADRRSITGAALFAVSDRIDRLTSGPRNTSRQRRVCLVGYRSILGFGQSRWQSAPER